MVRGRDKGPLRAIVGADFEESTDADGVTVRLPLERLECGHSQRAVIDIYGETNAHRRRCRQCRAEEG